MKTLLVYHNLDGFIVSIQKHIADALTELEIEWKECYIEDIEKASKEFEPTMHLFFHPNKKIYDYLEVVKNLKGHKLIWSMEDPYESDITFDLLPYFYYVFTSDKNTYEALKKESTANNIQYVPHACDPKIHRPFLVPYEYRSDILFIGNAYESRIEYFKNHAKEFSDKLVTIIGVGYRGLDGYSNQRVIHGHISEPEMMRFINGAKIVLNLHRQNSDLDMANKRKIEPMNLNNRFFEVLATGRKQIVEGRDNMKDDIEKFTKLKPEEYSYKARLVEYFLPLLK